VSVFVVIFLASWVRPIVENPLPLYGIGCAMVCYNVLFRLGQRAGPTRERDVQRNIFLQITLDLIALTGLLYFADLPHNPFLFFFVFHMIIAGMYLPRGTPYLVAGMASLLVGGVLLLEYFDWFPPRPMQSLDHAAPTERLDLFGLFLAFSSTLWITVYFTTSIRSYVDRAHAELRQKEKMLGIGQLVAGIAHQIANPLDGMQNCLQRIGDHVQDDPRLSEYVQLMTEALTRIERTAKRVQAFARPRGVTLQNTDVNQAVESTLKVLGTRHEANIGIATMLGTVPPVQGDPYTLQEVLFNLCANALAAMPDGGKLTLRTRALGRKDDDRMDSVAVDVSDTGVGIPPSQLEKVFEPFFTTRADSGGTGLGLGLCRMLISEMGGRINVRSTLNQGTTFTVVLNRADVMTAASTE